jgi:pyruvate dehydrogenase E1 component alpha subunit
VRRRRDPIERFEERTTEAGVTEADDLRRIDAEVVQAVADAVAWAEQSPLPSPEDVVRDVYASE